MTPLDPTRLGGVLESAVHMARSRGFSEERLEDIRTAVEEACRNALEHSGPGPRSSTSIDMTCEGERFVVVVMNPGPPFAVPTAKPDLRKKLDGLERSRGWGLFLIRSLADYVSVISHEGINELRIVFALHGHHKDSDRG